MAMALVTVAIGILFGNTVVFLAAIVPLTFAAYGYALRPPSLDVGVERTVSDASPASGDRVEVTITVRNEGDENLPDLRVYDDPPANLRVVEGAPAIATSLAPGESETFDYSLRADRGDHSFGAPIVVSRNLSGVIERRLAVDLQDDLSVVTDLDGFPLAEQTVQYTGRVPTNEGGEGVEFRSVREYRTNDPMNRVDWNRYARTRSLRTVEFREHRAASVVVVVDARESVAVASHEGAPDAVTLDRVAAEHVVETLLDRNHLVGLAVLGSGGGYLEPDAGIEQEPLARRFLEDGVSALSEAARNTPSTRLLGGSVDDRRRRLVDRLPEESQVVFVSPFLDDWPLSTVRCLIARGHAVTTVSPDVTTRQSLGGTIEEIDRTTRLSDVRTVGSRVVDWSVDEPLPVAVARATEGWPR
jgi:uncharacterized repeat protein (TIGR01451 family)